MELDTPMTEQQIELLWSSIQREFPEAELSMNNLIYYPTDTMRSHPDKLIGVVLWKSIHDYYECLDLSDREGYMEALYVLVAREIRYFRGNQDIAKASGIEPREWIPDTEFSKMENVLLIYRTAARLKNLSGNNDAENCYKNMLRQTGLHLISKYNPELLREEAKRALDAFTETLVESGMIDSTPVALTELLAATGSYKIIPDYQE